MSNFPVLTHFIEWVRSALYQISKLPESGFLLFRPKADDLRPCIFQDEIVIALCSIVSSDVWFRPGPSH